MSNPRCASSTATAAPTPRDAPVIKTTRCETLLKIRFLLESFVHHAMARLPTTRASAKMALPPVRNRHARKPGIGKCGSFGVAGLRGRAGCASRLRCFPQLRLEGCGDCQCRRFGVGESGFQVLDRPSE